MEDRIKWASIHAEMGHADCDDCGSFMHGTATLTMEDDEIATRVDHDGHRGGGSWDGQEVSLRRMALGLSGVAPYINGELAEGIPVLDSGEVDSSNSALWVAAHELAEWRRVDIELETLGDDPWYPTPVMARWTAPGGNPAVHVFKHGDWTSFWVDFCASFVSIEMAVDTLWPDD